MCDDWRVHDSTQSSSDTANLIAIANEIRGAIEAWPARNDTNWDKLAVRLMQAQRRAIATYAAWCKLDGAAIPALPIGAYKQHRVASDLPDAACWHSSGTTGAATSKHHLHDVGCYEASLRAGVRAALLADAPENLAVLQLAPTSSEAPNSSLSHMVDIIRCDMGLADAGTFVDGDFQVDAAGAWARLTELRATDTPVLVLATSFALVNLFDATVSEPALQLAPGSRVMDTGGTKGRVRDITRDEIVAMIGERLGVPASQCENEYGMSELSSQAWLGTFMTGADRDARWQPPWMRTRVVDPVTLRDVADGEQGLLVHYDLANVWSCAAIRSEDIGIKRGNSWQLVGRAPGAQLRGCSLQLEDLITA